MDLVKSLGVYFLTRLIVKLQLNISSGNLLYYCRSQCCDLFAVVFMLHMLCAVVIL